MSLRIDRMLYGGAGRADGLALPFTLPGELVAPSPLAILEPSPSRIPPRCPHFSACGGCHYQHAAYPAQLAIKRGILLDLLGSVGPPEPQPHHAEPWFYRNRIRLRFGTVEGAVRFGYNRPGSTDFLPVAQCPIAAPILLRAADALLHALDAPWQARLAEAELFTTPDQSRLQLTLFVRSARNLAQTSLDALCARLLAHLPELAGAGIVVTGPSGRQSQPGPAWGAPGLNYTAAGRTYWVPRGSFFQVNLFLVDQLVRLVTANRSGRIAWDLYAGVGLFTQPLQETFAAVIAVEAAPPPGSSTLAATVLDFLRHAVLERDRPQFIVLDPPRAGLGPEVCVLLARIAAPQLVYVSCDPTTLARDLRPLVDSGYTVTQLHLVDLFPQTFHIETVVFLNR